MCLAQPPAELVPLAGNRLLPELGASEIDKEMGSSGSEKAAGAGVTSDHRSPVPGPGEELGGSLTHWVLAPRHPGQVDSSPALASFRRASRGTK